MTTITQLFLNIVLTICFAFSVHLAVKTNQDIKNIKATFEVIELRDQMYNETRMQILEDLSEAIKDANKQIKLEQDRLNTF